MRHVSRDSEVLDGEYLSTIRDIRRDNTVGTVALARPTGPPVESQARILYLRSVLHEIREYARTGKTDEIIKRVDDELHKTEWTLIEW